MKERFFSFVILLSFCLTFFAGAARPKKPDSVLRATLRNGMRVIIIRDTFAPVVATIMNYEVGSDDSPPDFPGMAHAQEHMMFRGSKSLSADQLSEITAITGGGFNAETQNTVTQYFYIVPAQDLDIALRLEASRASNLDDSAEQWNEERGAIEQEVTQDNSEADYRLFAQMQENILKGSPDAISGLGTVPSFEKTTSEMLRQFYAKYYHPNNAIFVIAGDVNPEKTLLEVKQLFEKIPAGKPFQPNYGKVKPQQPATYKTESDYPYTLIMVGYPFPGYADKEWAAAEILGDVLSSRRGPLYALVANGKALDSFFSPGFFPADGSAYAGLSVPVGTDPDAAVKELKEAIAEYQKNGLPVELVEGAKQREIASAEFNRNSIYGLANAWSQAVAVEGRNSPDEDIQAVKKVTVDDVNAVLRKYLLNDAATVGIAVPKPGSLAAGGGGNAPENNTVIPKGPVSLPNWAQKILSDLKPPEPLIHPVVMKLPNGITLIVQEERETPTVILSGLVRNNPQMETPKGKMGVEDIANGLFPFGTQTYSRLAYQAELDKISATVTAGTSFSLSVLSRHFDRGVQLLADDELHPAFFPKDFQVMKSETLSEVKGEETSPDHLAEVAMAKALYPADDPDVRFATPQSVSGLKLEDVKAFYKNVFRPDMTTIVIVGDITPAEAKRVVTRYFWKWKAKGAKPEVYPKAVRDNKPAYQVIPATGRIQDQVTLSQTLKLTRKDGDFAPLVVANAILGKGFYASLLYHDLREVKGYVYYVESSLAPGKKRSTFNISYGSMPDKTQAAKNLVLADLRMLQKGPIPKERLRNAKALLLGEVPLLEQSYDGVANQLLKYAAYGYPLDENVREARAELAVTENKIEGAMRRWIRPDDLVEIVEGPPPGKK